MQTYARVHGVFFSGSLERISRKFPDIESKLWRGVMWSPSYYVVTAGHVSAETIERYIKEQQTEWKCGSSTG